MKRRFIDYRLKVTKITEQQAFGGWDKEKYTKNFPADLFGEMDFGSYEDGSVAICGTIIKNTARECSATYQLLKERIKFCFVKPYKGAKLIECVVMKGDKLW